MLPAVAQGAIGITCRADDPKAHRWLSLLHDGETMARVAAERAFLAKLDGSCRTPIAALAELRRPDLDHMTFRGLIISPDGRSLHATRREGRPEDGPEMGVDAALELSRIAGPGFFG